MKSQRTVLVIASSEKDDTIYQQQLQQDREMDYNILLGRSTAPPAFSPSTVKLDGILLELGFPYNHSLQLLRQLKEQTSAPVIVIDGGDTEIAVQAFKHGAVDYLVKDRATPDDLRLAMRSAIENAELKRELQRSQETFRTSVENMLDCFGIFSAIRDDSGQIVDFRVDYLNAVACKNNQMPKAMQIGRGLCEILPAHRESGLFDEYCQVVNTGEPLIRDSLVYDDTYGDRRLIRAFDIRATKLNDGFVASWRDVTDRKQLELELSQTVADLRASQQHNHDLAEAMPQIVWTADATGDVNYWNHAWYEYTGLSEAESFGLARLSKVHPEERDRVLTQWNHAVTHGQSLEIEYRIQNRKGEYRWFICRAVPSRDRQNQITGWIGTITDIDHQKQTALALQQSQERLELAMRAASMGSWDWNIQTGEVHWSTNLEHLFGMAPGSFDGRYETVRAMMHPEDLPRVEAAIQRALYDRQDYNIEFRFIKPDGHVRWALGLGRVFYDDDGNPVMMAGVDRDISAWKQAEAALRTSERRYRSLVEATAQIIWNTQGNQAEFTTEQPSWSAFTGQTFDELEGLGWLNAVHPDDRAKTTQTCLTALEAQTFCEVEYRLRRHDGVYRHMQVRAVPVFDETGTILEWLGINTDITDSKRAAAALADNEARLRGFVEANVVGIIYGDIHGNIHAANDKLLRMVGYTQDDVQAGRLRWVDITPPEYLPLDERRIAEACAHGACTPYEKEYIRKDGSRVPVLIGYTLLGEAREETVVFVLDLSDRKQAEQALQASEERFRQLAENIDAVFWVKELPENRISYVSSAYQRLWGLQPQHLYDNPNGWYNYIDPADRDTVAQAFREQATTGEFDQEYRIVLADGTRRWVRDRCFPLRDEAGNVYRLAGITEDITERKQTHEALLENGQLLRLALAGAKAGSWDWNIQTNEVTWSPENYGLYGVGTENESNWYRLWHTTIHPEDRERVRLELLQAVEQRQVEFEVEFRIVHPQRGLRWLLGLGRFILNERGEPIRLSGLNLDITDRKQAEENLRQSEEFKNRLLASSPDCIKVLDIDGRLLYMNAGGMCIMEIDDLTPYLNQDWVCLWGDEYRPLAEQALETAKTGEVSIFRGFCPTAKGTPKWWEVIVSPIRGASGKTEQVLSVSRDISDRRQAELRLQESEERLQLGMQVTGFVLVQIDYSTNTVNLSPEAAALYGLPADRLTISREQFHAIFHTEDRLQLEERIQEILDPAGSGWFTQDHRILRNTGEVKWLTLRKQVFFDSSSPPQPSHAILVALDITERKQAEQNLQENELRFQTMADNISQLAWMTDENGWIFWYNQRWFDFTGTTLEDMQGWGWQTVHHPDHVDRVVEKISQCFATGEIWEDTFPLRGQNGEYRWFLSRAVPIRDEQRRVLRWFGTNTDITELREIENALRQSEERYRCLADSIPQLVWMSNGKGELLDVNQRWTAFTGLSLEQAWTSGWETVVHPEDVPVLAQHWAEAIQRGTHYQAEGRMRRADGTYRWFLHQAIPQRNEQGQIIKWFGTATDIDIQKQLELDRDRLLQQEQAAREAAERANRIKDEFLAVLSHELRSPLNPILGWTKLLQSRKFDAAKTADALATIERNAKLQTQLIDDLLDVAKILRGKLVMEMATVDLAFVIESAIDTVRAAAVAKSIRLHSLLPQIGHISGDSARLQQIVWNLLSNAIKFTPNHGRVDILLERVSNQAQITVRDTGKGITPTFLPYLFESFRQEDASTTRKYGGLGLGLAIVRSLVEAHGGTITADSPGEDQGATFTVCFPLLNMQPKVQPTEQRPMQDLDLRDIRVLAVDDEPDARELLATVLTVYGAEVLTVTSADEVLTALESFQPDVLVSDIGMPGVDGYCLIQQIRALPSEQGGQIPAIALTAYAREEDHQRSIASGFQQQVTKPLEPEQLVQVVVTLVRGLG